jgi:hypothetical protein
MSQDCQIKQSKGKTHTARSIEEKKRDKKKRRSRGRQKKRDLENPHFSTKTFSKCLLNNVLDLQDF